jgi:hypothetical protein
MTPALGRPAVWARERFRASSGRTSAWLCVIDERPREARSRRRVRRRGMIDPPSPSCPRRAPGDGRFVSPMQRSCGSRALATFWIAAGGRRRHVARACFGSSAPELALSERCAFARSAVDPLFGAGCATMELRAARLGRGYKEGVRLTDIDHKDYFWSTWGSSVSFTPLDRRRRAKDSVSVEIYQISRNLCAGHR